MIIKVLKCEITGFGMWATIRQIIKSTFGAEIATTQETNNFVFMCSKLRLDKEKDYLAFLSYTIGFMYKIDEISEFSI